jgi:hypothetical protein
MTRTLTIRTLLMALALAVLTTAACNADEYLNGDDKAEQAVVDTGPRKRAARRADVRCYDSFGKFKRAMAKLGQTSKKKESEWHHIVGQHNHNVRKFGAHDA